MKKSKLNKIILHVVLFLNLLAIKSSVLGMMLPEEGGSWSGTLNSARIVTARMRKDTSTELSKFVQSLEFNPYESHHFGLQLMGDTLREFLPDETIASLRSLAKADEQSPDVVLIKGLPVEVLLPTADKRYARQGSINERIITGLAELMDHKLYTSPKQQGGLCHNVAPNPALFHTKSGQGGLPFDWHIENAYEQRPPRHLVLSCIEGDPVARTSFLAANDLLSSIPSEVLESMKQPSYEFVSGEAYQIKEQGVFPLLAIDPEDQARILRLYENNPRLRALTPEAEQTLTVVREAFVKSRQLANSVSLEPGDYLLFNNAHWFSGGGRGVLHGRSGTVI